MPVLLDTAFTDIKCNIFNSFNYLLHIINMKKIFLFFFLFYSYELIFKCTYTTVKEQSNVDLPLNNLTVSYRKAHNYEISFSKEQSKLLWPQ